MISDVVVLLNGDVDTDKAESSKLQTNLENPIFDALKNSQKLAISFQKFFRNPALIRGFSEFQKKLHISKPASKLDNPPFEKLENKINEITTKKEVKVNEKKEIENASPLIKKQEVKVDEKKEEPEIKMLVTGGVKSFEDMMQSMKDSFNKYKDIFSLNNIKNLFKGLLTPIKSLIGDIVAPISEELGKVMGVISGVISSALGPIGSVLMSIKSMIPNGQTILKFAILFLPLILGFLKKHLKGVFDFLKSAFKLMFKGFKIMIDVGEWLMSGHAWDDIKEFISAIFNDFRNTLSHVPGLGGLATDDIKKQKKDEKSLTQTTYEHTKKIAAKTSTDELLDKIKRLKNVEDDSKKYLKENTGGSESSKLSATSSLERMQMRIKAMEDEIKSRENKNAKIIAKDKTQMTKDRLQNVNEKNNNNKANETKIINNHHTTAMGGSNTTNNMNTTQRLGFER